MNFHPSGLLGKTNITGKMNLNWKDSVPFVLNGMPICFGSGNCVLNEIDQWLVKRLGNLQPAFVR